MKKRPETMRLKELEKWLDTVSEEEFEAWEKDCRQHPFRTLYRMVLADIKQDPVRCLLIPMATSVLTVLLIPVLQWLLR